MYRAFSVYESLQLVQLKSVQIILSCTVTAQIIPVQHPVSSDPVAESVHNVKTYQCKPYRILFMFLTLKENLGIFAASV